MAKLVRQKFITTSGERKTYAYLVAIPKRIVEQVGLQDTDINVYVEGERIIIEKKK